MSSHYRARVRRSVATATESAPARRNTSAPILLEPSMSTTSSATTPLALYDFQLSGHCHRVRLMLSLLGVDYETIPVDLVGGEHKREPFLSLNPMGQVPVLRAGDAVIA